MRWRQDLSSNPSSMAQPYDAQAAPTVPRSTHRPTTQFLGVSSRASRCPSEGTHTASAFPSFRPGICAVTPPPSSHPHLDAQLHLQKLSGPPNLRAAPRCFRFQIQTMAAKLAHGTLGVGGASGTTPRSAEARAVGFPPAPGRSFQIWGGSQDAGSPWAEGLVGRGREEGWGSAPSQECSAGWGTAWLLRRVPPLLAWTPVSDTVLEMRRSKGLEVRPLPQHLVPRLPQGRAEEQRVSLCPDASPQAGAGFASRESLRTRAVRTQRETSPAA